MKKIFTHKSATPFYLTKRSPLRTSGRYAVILSPEFYWIKRVSLPVKTVREARRLAESVFEGIVPEGRYDYIVTKEGDRFLIIAYDPSLIRKELAHHFSGTSEVGGVYFAQNEFSNLEGCVTVNAQAALTLVDGIVVQVPRSCVDGKVHMDDLLPTVQLSHARVRIPMEGERMLPRSVAFPAIAAILLFAVAFLVEGIGYHRAASAMQERKSELISQYGLPQTSFQLRSIEASLQKRYRTQKRLRDLLQKIGQLSLAQGEALQALHYSKKGITLLFSGVGEGHEEVLRRRLMKIGKIAGSQRNGTRYKVEMAL